MFRRRVLIARKGNEFTICSDDEHATREILSGSVIYERFERGLLRSTAEAAALRAVRQEVEMATFRDFAREFFKVNRQLGLTVEEVANVFARAFVTGASSAILLDVIDNAVAEALSEQPRPKP